MIKDLIHFHERSDSIVKDQTRQVIDFLRKEQDTTNWLNRLITARDTISHYKKNDMFAFQVDITYKKRNGINVKIIPPQETEDQTIRGFLKIIRYNLLTFCEDFIAVLLKPFLDSTLNSFTYRNHNNNPIYYPKWYIWPKDLPFAPKNIALAIFGQFISNEKFSHLDTKSLIRIYGHYLQYDR